VTETLSLLPQTVLLGIMTGGIYALIAMGMSLIFGVMRIVNFAHGDFIMIAMFITFFLNAWFGVDPLVAMPASAAILACSGFVLESFILRRAREKGGLYLGGKELTTLMILVGISYILANGAQIAWSADYRSLQVAYSDAFIEVGGSRISLPYFSLPQFPSLS